MPGSVSIAEILSPQQSLVFLLTTLWVQLDPEQDLVDLPEMVQRYHSLYPLEDVIREEEAPSSSLGVRTMIFKGVSSSDGQAYAIRRIDSRQVTLDPDMHKLLGQYIIEDGTIMYTTLIQRI